MAMISFVYTWWIINEFEIKSDTCHLRNVSKLHELYKKKILFYLSEELRDD